MGVGDRIEPELCADSEPLEVTMRYAGVDPVVPHGERPRLPPANLHQRARLDFAEDVSRKAAGGGLGLRLGGRKRVQLAERLLDGLDDLALEEVETPCFGFLARRLDRMPEANLAAARNKETLVCARDRYAFALGIPTISSPSSPNRPIRDRTSLPVMRDRWTAAVAIGLPRWPATRRSHRAR